MKTLTACHSISSFDRLLIVFRSTIVNLNLIRLIMNLIVNLSLKSHWAQFWSPALAGLDWPSFGNAWLVGFWGCWMLCFGVVGTLPPPPPLPHTTYITILRLQLFKRLTYRYMMPNSDSTVQKTHLYTYMLKDSLIDLLIIYDSAQIQTQLSKRRTCTLIDAQRFTYRRTYSIWFCSNSDSTVQKTHL